MKKFILPMITDESRLPFYVYCVGGMGNQSPIDRPDGYAYYIWLHSVAGKGKLHLERKEYILTANTGLLLYPGVAHEYYALEEPWETHWVAFQGFAASPTLAALGLRVSGVFPLTNTRQLDRQLHDIFVAAMSAGPDRGLQCSHKLYSFLAGLRQSIVGDRNRPNLTANSRMQRVLGFMEEHYGDDLTLEQMAALIEASPQYLCRIFKQALAMSPFAYLTRLRLQKAKEILLEQSSVTVAETAGMVGYHDSSYFCSVFKQHEGMTPLEFRKYCK